MCNLCNWTWVFKYSTFFFRSFSPLFPLLAIAHVRNFHLICRTVNGKCNGLNIHSIFFIFGINLHQEIVTIHFEYEFPYPPLLNRHIHTIVQYEKWYRISVHSVVSDTSILLPSLNGKRGTLSQRIVPEGWQHQAHWILLPIRIFIICVCVSSSDWNAGYVKCLN